MKIFQPYLDNWPEEDFSFTQNIVRFRYKYGFVKNKSRLFSVFD